MDLKNFSGSKNSLRHKVTLKKGLLTKTSNLFKICKKGIKNVSGRSLATGHITTRHKGHGVKNVFRFINFNNYCYLSIIICILYDPNRTSFINLNFNVFSNRFFYTLSTHLVPTGTLLLCHFDNVEIKLGYRMLLKNIPIGSIINSLSLNDQSVKYIRSAGTFGVVIEQNSGFCKVKLPSNKVLIVSSLSTFASIGTISNIQNNLQCLGKAGSNRLRGIRPSVRGIAMNPVDHPHGGRTNGGRTPVTPWGKITRGQLTRKKKN